MRGTWATKAEEREGVHAADPIASEPAGHTASGREPVLQDAAQHVDCPVRNDWDEV